MRPLIELIALLVIGALVTSIAFFVLGRNPIKLAEGKLRCQDGGAIVINVDGKDYAMNGMASTRFPPIQDIWNKSTFPETDTDRLIVRGLTLCDWSTWDRGGRVSAGREATRGSNISLP
jgi:hypothetical protein